MPPPFTVTRAQLKAACEQQQWDLLDKLLEIDSSQIDDPALFSDTWGTWWGMLVSAVTSRAADGVRVLKHGARRDAATWGDCVPKTALELARDTPEILALLLSDANPTYVRTTDPTLPTHAAADDQTLQQQGEIRDTTGLVFQPPAIERPPDQ